MVARARLRPRRSSGAGAHNPVPERHCCECSLLLLPPRWLFRFNRMSPAGHARLAIEFGKFRSSDGVVTFEQWIDRLWDRRTDAMRRFMRRYSAAPNRPSAAGNTILSFCMPQLASRATLPGMRWDTCATALWATVQSGYSDEHGFSLILAVAVICLVELNFVDA